MDSPASPTRRSATSSRGLGAISFERQVLLSAWLVALPAAITAGVLLWRHGEIGPLGMMGLMLAVVATAILAARLQHQVVYPLYTLANLLEALREGDYSLRGSRAQRRDAIGEVVWEVNTLSQTLRDLEGVTPEILDKLDAGGIQTRDDLADLAIDELTDLTGQNADEARALIMKAREHWFAGQE